MVVTVTFNLRVVGEFQPYEFGTTLSEEYENLSADDILAKDPRILKLSRAAQEHTYDHIELAREISPDFDTIFQARQDVIKKTKLKFGIS